MKKIPVGQAITHAYRYAFREFPGLARVGWLPLIVMIGMNVVLAPQLAALQHGFPTRDFSGVTMPLPLVALCYAVTMVAAFMLMTAILQYALGRPEAFRHRWFYFSVGKPLWRLVGALLLLAAVIAVLALVFWLAMLAIGFVFNLGFHAAHMNDAAIRNVATMDAALAMLVFECGLVFCAVRFGFLLGPATIALDKVALVQSWQFSNGNFWRLFAVLLAVVLPLLSVALFMLYLLGAFPPVPAGASAADIRALQQAASATLSARMEHYWFLYYPISAVLNVVLIGLGTAAQVFCWRALTDTPHAEPVEA